MWLLVNSRWNKYIGCGEQERVARYSIYPLQGSLEAGRPYHIVIYLTNQCDGSLVHSRSHLFVMLHRLQVKTAFIRIQIIKIIVPIHDTRTTHQGCPKPVQESVLSIKSLTTDTTNHECTVDFCLLMCRTFPSSSVIFLSIIGVRFIWPLESEAPPMWLSYPSLTDRTTRNARSSTYAPSFQRSGLSCACTICHPTYEPQCTQNNSRTVCAPLVMSHTLGWPRVTFVLDLE